jgi:drug/metabolite transporter (DMT)-like permease
MEHFGGEVFSLLTAIVWAVAMVLFKRSGDSIPPFALNLFRVGVSSVLFLVTLPFVSSLTQFSLRDFGVLAASGIIGIAISDTLFHRGLNLMGASTTGIVDCLYSPFVAIFAMWMLGESLTLIQWLGLVLVIVAVLLASENSHDKNVSQRNLWIGVGYGVAAMLTVAFGVVIAKPILAHTNIVWATSIRQFCALGVMVPVALLLKNRRETFAVFRWGSHWRFALPGTLLGSYLALMLWLAGMKFARAGVAAVLNQTSTIWVLILAACFLGEKFSLRKAIATVLALGGILLVMN